MDEFYKPELSATEDAIMSKLQEQIHYCLNCQPRDSGEWIWIYGERHDLEDLLDEYELEEKQKDKIVSHLICPFCGTQLDRGYEVGLKGIDDYEYENNYFTILDFVKKINEQLDKLDKKDE